MNVLRTISSFYPNITGPANQAYEISKRLEARGIESPIWTTTQGVSNQPKQEDIDGISVRRFDNSIGYMRYSLSPGFIYHVYQNDADLIHAHGYRNFLTDAAYTISQLNDVPIVLHAHGTFIGYRSIVEGKSQLPYRVYDAITRKHVARNADAVLVSTSMEWNEAKEFGIPKDILHTVPVGINVNEYTKFPRTPPSKKFRLLFVGRISRNRNVELIIKSLSHLSEDVELRIVGSEVKSSTSQSSGYVDELKSLAQQLGVQDRVSFVGAKYDDNLLKEYRSAHAFVYPSNYENFGQAILEAGAAGLPIISTPVGVATDIVRNGETGYIIENEDHQGLAESVDYLRGETSDFGSKVQRIIIENFTWEDIVDKYVRIYKELI